MAEPNVIIYGKYVQSQITHIASPDYYIVLTASESSLLFGSWKSNLGTSYLITTVSSNPGVVFKPKSGIIRVNGLWAYHNYVGTFMLGYSAAELVSPVYSYKHFAVRFYDYACTKAPRLTAWDRGKNSADSILFLGTPVTTNAPLLRALNSTKSRPTNTNFTLTWYLNSVSASSGGNNVYLRGNDSYLTSFVTGTGTGWDSANGEWDFDLALICPSDLGHDFTYLDFDLELTYFWS